MLRNKVKEFREKANMTQEQLAKKLGVSRQTIISIEADRYNPSLILAFKIASAFDRLIEDVFDFSEVKGEIEHE
nr:helix-turn-helix transcriptional regulator [Geosporobacter ferrireducens]